MEKNFKVTFEIVDHNNYAEAYVTIVNMKDIPDGADTNDIAQSIVQGWDAMFLDGHALKCNDFAGRPALVTPQYVKRIVINEVKEIVEGEVHEGNN